MKVKVWGARGSVPTPGASTNRYGGNASCLQVTLSDGRLIVLDAGSGIRNLGLRLAGRARRIDILLTHLHLDHIQGLMFFAPLFMPDAEIVIWAPPAAETLSERLARYLSPPLTPLHLRELPARISFRVCPKGEWEIGPARIHAAPVTHPGPTHGYRISEGDTSLCYIPDQELALGHCAASANGSRCPASIWHTAPRSSSTIASTPTTSTRVASAGATPASATCSPSLGSPRHSASSSSTTTRSMTTSSSIVSTPMPLRAGLLPGAARTRSSWPPSCKSSSSTAPTRIAATASLTAASCQ